MPVTVNGPGGGGGDRATAEICKATGKVLRAATSTGRVLGVRTRGGTRRGRGCAPARNQTGWVRAGRVESEKPWVHGVGRGWGRVVSGCASARNTLAAAKIGGARPARHARHGEQKGRPRAPSWGASAYHCPGAQCVPVTPSTGVRMQRFGGGRSAGSRFWTQALPTPPGPVFTEMFRSVHPSSAVRQRAHPGAPVGPPGVVVHEDGGGAAPDPRAWCGRAARNGPR